MKTGYGYLYRPKWSEPIVTNKKNCAGSDDEFPLDAYAALYTWIGQWAEETDDPEQRMIAQAAYESLTAVGVYMLDFMRQMADETEAMPGPKTVH